MLLRNPQFAQADRQWPPAPPLRKLPRGGWVVREKRGGKCGRPRRICMISHRSRTFTASQSLYEHTSYTRRLQCPALLFRRDAHAVLRPRRRLPAESARVGPSSRHRRLQHPPGAARARPAKPRAVQNPRASPCARPALSRCSCARASSTSTTCGARPRRATTTTAMQAARRARSASGQSHGMLSHRPSKATAAGSARRPQVLLLPLRSPPTPSTAQLAQTAAARPRRRKHCSATAQRGRAHPSPPTPLLDPAAPCRPRRA